jgi:hypothetical protein
MFWPTWRRGKRRERGGFGRVDDEALAEMTDRAVQLYVRQELDDLPGKKPAFCLSFSGGSADCTPGGAGYGGGTGVSDFQLWILN